MSAAFDLAGANRLGSGYPSLPEMNGHAGVVPATLLKAIGWVESNWQQFTPSGVPLVSSDFGYGTMQITSGMPGAFGKPLGTLPPPVQGRIGGSYQYNIAQAATMLVDNWNWTPNVGSNNATDIEDWYYAVWAYNGWGWANNPNNPTFTRQGTPATDPESFPYQERVFYWVSHPPKDSNGQLLWKPIHVDLPSRSQIGDKPGNVSVKKEHSEPPLLDSATFDLPSKLQEMRAGSSVAVHVRVFNAGGTSWQAISGHKFKLTYYWVHSSKGSNADPNLGGNVVASGPRVSLGSVGIGGSERVGIRVKAPNQTGPLSLEWDVVAPDGKDFSALGGKTGLQAVSVVSRQDSVPPYHDPPAPLPLIGNNARYVTTTSAALPADMLPDQQFEEDVLLFNPGANMWATGYALTQLSSGQTYPLSREVEKCRIYVLRIKGSAPLVPGSYDLRYRLTAANGKLFGPTISVKLVVLTSLLSPASREFDFRPA